MEYKIAIITGESRGLGYSLVKTYCNTDYKVISIARNIIDFTPKNYITHIQFDLSDIENFTLLQKELQKYFIHTITEIVLINNAGDLGKVTTVKNLKAKEIDQNIGIKQFKNTKTTIYNISSGASLKPYYDWVNYYSSKTGIEIATKTIAIEQEENSSFTIYSINPGVMDTNMQKQIRKSKKKDFKQIERFISLKEKKQLVDSSIIADKIISIEGKNYKNGSTIII